MSHPHVRHTRRLTAIVAVTTLVSIGLGSIASAVPAKHRTPPPVFTAQPANPTKQATATFAWGAPAGTTYVQQTCRLDATASASCASGTVTYSNLVAGRHSFALTVKASGAGKKSLTTTKTWTVDTAPPPPPVILQPPTPTSSTAVVISFTEADAAATLTCSLDSAAPAPCVSPFSASGLADGPHTFAVTASDGAGNSVTSSVSWLVDTMAPATVVITPPTSPTNDPLAGATFVDGGPVDHYTCSIDHSSPVTCTSPWTPSGPLVDGTHTLTVIAFDSANNASAGSATWVVDTGAPPAPFVVDGPAPITNQTSAIVDFDDAERASTFQCRIDSASAASWAPCASPWSNGSALATGPHALDIRARDAAGNTSPTTTVSWTVDPTAFEPPVFFSGPDDPSSDRAPSFSFDVLDDTNNSVQSFTWSVTDGAFTANGTALPTDGPTEVDLTGAADGLLTFTAVSVYAGGSSSPAVYSWHLDTTAPPAPVIAAVATPTHSAAVTFTDAASDVASFSCSVDGAPTVQCASPFVVSGPDGSHVVAVTAADVAQNDGPSAASNPFVVKNSTTAPAFDGSDVHGFTTTQVVLHLHSTDAGDSLACALDGGLAADCTSGTWSGSGADGAHSLVATATDSLGDQASAEWAFTIDTTTTPPTTPPPTVTPPTVTPPTVTPPTVTPPTVVLGESVVRTVASWRIVRAARALGHSYVTERAAGASVLVPFTGTSVTWFGVSGPTQGRAHVYVDGHLVARVNTYATTPRLRVPHTVGHLRKGKHVLRIVVDGKRGAAHARDAFVSLDAVRFAGRTRTTTPATFSWRTVKVGGVMGVSTDCAGAALTAAFTGSAITWTDLTGPHAGRLRVVIDGATQGVLDDHSATVGTITHTVAGLAIGQHVLQLIAAPRSARGSPVTVLGVH